MEDEDDDLKQIYFSLYFEKNSDGTKNLLLQGNVLQKRIGRRITDSDMDQLTSLLLEHQNIVKLDLCYNRITDLGIYNFVDDYLSEPNNLQELNLMGNEIQEDGIAKICSLGENFKLKTLRLNGNKFGEEGGRQLSELIMVNSHLLYLDISETDQTLSSIAHITSGLFVNVANTTLKVLDISRIIPNSYFYPYDTAHLCESLGNLLRYNKTLVELHIQKNQITGHDIEIFLLDAKLNKTLQFLDLGYNNLGTFGIEIFSEYLKTRPNLLALNIAGNSIGDSGARSLSFALPFSKIRLLDISSNKITDTGMIDILNTIKKPYFLRYMCVWGNKFTHPTNVIINRMLESGVLFQEYLDVKIYKVDEILYAARYPSDHYKHKFYCEMDYSCPVDLKFDEPHTLVLDTKIKYNKLREDDPLPKVDFKHYPILPS